MQDPTQTILAGIWAATDGSNTQPRRQAKEENQEDYADYDPQTYFLDQVTTRDLKQVHCMLLSMLFDLSRKMAYIRLATASAVGEGFEAVDPELAATIINHNDELREFDTALPDIDWEQRATRAWHLLLNDLLLAQVQSAAGGESKSAERTVMDALRDRAAAH
jgi:hypothetical protein